MENDFPIFQAQLAEVLQGQSRTQGGSIEGQEGLENRLENDFPIFQDPEAYKIAAPSKMELAIQWLKEHPEDLRKTGRDLKELRRPQGVKISHKTWNDAKKAMKR